MFARLAVKEDLAPSGGDVVFSRARRPLGMRRNDNSPQTPLVEVVLPAAHERADALAAGEKQAYQE